jgi:cytochrome c oxidase cbb3-type subunit 3
MSDNNSKFDQPIAGHDYDGIQEFDNPLPMWWLWTFFGTIIFAFTYYIHHEFGGAPTLNQELEADMAAIESLKKTGPVVAIEELAGFLNDKNKIAAGSIVFKEKCAACHGPFGGGLIGPNLTDNFWISGGGTPEDILSVIEKGVLEKGMPPWKDTLKTVDTFSVVAYIVSLRGSAPVNAKPPEGKEYSYK